jgi:hypothetical protein
MEVDFIILVQPAAGTLMINIVVRDFYRAVKVVLTPAKLAERPGVGPREVLVGGVRVSGQVLRVQEEVGMVEMDLMTSEPVVV